MGRRDGTAPARGLLAVVRFVWGASLDAARGAWVVLCVIVLHVVVQQRRLAERLEAACDLAFEQVVVQLNGQDRGRLVFDDPVHWGRKRAMRSHTGRYLYCFGCARVVHSHGSLLYLFVVGRWIVCGCLAAAAEKAMHQLTLVLLIQTIFVHILKKMWVVPRANFMTMHYQIPHTIAMMIQTKQTHLIIKLKHRRMFTEIRCGSCLLFRCCIFCRTGWAILTFWSLRDRVRFDLGSTVSVYEGIRGTNVLSVGLITN